MRLRKTAATLVLCAAGMSVMGAGTAFAAENQGEVLSEHATLQECSAALDQYQYVRPAMCEPTTDDPAGPQVLMGY